MKLYATLSVIAHGSLELCLKFMTAGEFAFFLNWKHLDICSLKKDQCNFTEKMQYFNSANRTSQNSRGAICKHLEAPF